MIDWTAIRTAYKVGKLGTISAAADELGIHRASIVRHINSVEEQLGQKIFIRNHRGYQPTEMGYELIEAVGKAESQLSLLFEKAQNHNSELSGELVICSGEFRSSLILPAVKRFQSSHPNVHLRLISGDNLGQLEFGESHIVIQALEADNHPDYVVQELVFGEIRLYASKQYIDKHGMPERKEDLKKHRFFKPPQSVNRPDFAAWLEEVVPEESFYLTANSIELSEEAILAGLIVGFIPTLLADQHEDLVPLLPELPPWNYSFYVMTHRDVHRTPKVQAFLNILKRCFQNA